MAIGYNIFSYLIVREIHLKFLRLRETYSLLSKGYYTNLGVGLGSSFGILFVAF
jgi:hypothetical protein